MIQIPKEDLIVLMEGGYICLHLGRYEEAREVFEGVAVLAPESEVPLVAIGSVFFAQFRYDQAVKVYRKAIALKPDSAFARAYLGESLFFRGKKTEAIAELEKASMLEPQGKSGDFARTLLESIEKGFVPPGQGVQQ